MVEDPDSDDPSSQSYDTAYAEREAHYPETGYNLVEIDMMSPPGEALTLLNHSLTLSAITIPPATDFEDYVVYDQHGRGYSHDELRDSTDAIDPDCVDELLETVQSSDGKDQRLALLGLVRNAETNPDACLAAIPVLTTHLEASEQGVRAEALTALSHIADEYPEQVTPAAENVIQFLSPNTDSELLADAISIVAAIADHDPSAVVDAVPKLAALLQDGSPAPATAITALQRIAAAYPDSVVPITPQLLTYIEDGDDTNRIGAIAVLGTLSKEYPHVAEDTIPMATELLDAEYYKLRANAVGLLADLADEYPTEVRPVVPQAIELLDDDDEKARYNATSILARIAKAHPEDVEAAIDPLIKALDDDFCWTRSNACWALGYLKAERALERLEELKQENPEKEVRDVAEFAVHEINGS